MTLRFISLFAGIGGIDLGLELAGMRCVAQVEINNHARSVLNKHWPDVPRYCDVRSVSAWNLPACDVLAGGLPCQPHSLGGLRKSSADERDLWPEFYRLICEIRPRFVLVENVPGLLSSEAGRYFGRLLSELAQAGYDAEWGVLSACALGAPHPRERLFILSYPQQIRWQRGSINERSSSGIGQREAGIRSQCPVALESLLELSRRWWATQPDICRVADGVPHRLDRLGSLGNAVVPFCAEILGRMILDHYQRTR